jgi:hypothetical protein
MSILKKRNILKLATTFMLMGMMAGAFVGHTKAAFAVSCPTDNTTPFGFTGVTGEPTACDLAITPNGNPLAESGLTFFSSAATFTNAAIAVGDNPFSFGVTVADVRNNTNGWRLEASSAGLDAGSTTHLPLALTSDLITSTGGNCVVTSGASGLTDCPNPTFTALAPVPAVGHDAPFFTETPDSTDSVANPISGTVALTINGTFNVPVGTPAGAYTGAITLTIMDTF